MRGSPTSFHGLPVAPGLALGQAFVYTTDISCVLRQPIPPEQVDQEVARYRRAWEETERYYQASVEEAARDFGAQEAEILKSHLEILRDPYFLDEVPQLIRSKRENAEWLVSEGVKLVAEALSTSPDPYLRERAADVHDVGRQLLHRLLDVEVGTHIPGHDIVLVARELTPSDVLRLKKSPVLAIVTELGTATSHAAVIAKPLGIPVVMGVQGILQVVRHGDTVFVDGASGEVHLNPSPEFVEHLTTRLQQARDRGQRIAQRARDPAVTLDGRRIVVMANIAHPDETEVALRMGAEGVGLLRTEFSFLAKGRLLTEEEQVSIYRAVVEGMKGQPVVIRTLDLGGDKLVPHHERQPEANPFLGWRSIRISLHLRDSFRAQIRAILRASVVGPTRIMFPMISTVDELVEANRILDEVVDEFHSQGTSVSVQRGIMVEVPSVAVNIRAFLPHTDFVSIGTNDLVQYTLAVDRSNPRVASYYRPCDPAVLRLIRHTAACAQRAGKHAAVCGEMAGDARYVPLLVGLGVHQLSMTPRSIPLAKHVIRHIAARDAVQLAQRAVRCSTSSQVEEMLDSFLEAIPGLC